MEAKLGAPAWAPADGTAEVARARPSGKRTGGAMPLRGAVVLVLGWALAAIGSAGCSREKEPPPPPPNIVLITMDTTRLDHLGCYGAVAHTPTIDSLAAAGVRFDNAFATYPVTLPSHASIMTGKTSVFHGVRDNAGYVLEASHVRLAERLAQAGYQTGAAVSAFVLAEQFGLAQGFDTYDDRFYTERSGVRTTHAALRWIDQISTKLPYFLWVHYFDPHTPYRPVEPYRSLDLSSDYAKEIAAMDGAIGELLDGLRQRGRLENIVICLTADHGEGLGDHGEGEHGLFLYDETMHVPLILTYPGAPAGMAVAPAVSTVDIAPTLIDLAGAASLGAVDGANLMPLVRGELWNPRRAPYAETYFPEFNYYYSHLKAMRTGRWKYIEAPRPELYDLHADPDELVNLLEAAPDTARIFRERLARYLAGAPPVEVAESQISSEALERIQSLGYLSGGEVTAVSADLPDPKDMKPILDTFTAAKEAAYEEQWEKARDGFDAVLAHNPSNVVAALHLGRVLLRLHDEKRAVEVLELARALAPENTTIAKHLGRAYRMADRPEDGLQTFELAAADPVQKWFGVVGVAGCYVDMGEFEKALAYLREQTAGLGQETPATALIGRIEAYVQARAQYAAAATVPHRLRLAGLAMDLERVDEARQLLDVSPVELRDRVYRLRLLGNLEGSAGSEALAVARFEEARALDPSDGYVNEQLGSLYLALDRPAEARQVLLQAIAVGRNDPRNYYNLACAQARTGDVDAAVRALGEATERGYTDADKLLEDPDLAALQGDPGFQRLTERISRNQ